MDWDDIQDRWNQLQQNIAQDKADREQQYQASLQPGDETTPSNSWSNSVQDTLGLPQSWRQTVAQQKYNALQPQPNEARSPILEASAGPEAELAEGVGNAAEKLGPELQQLVAQVKANPNTPLQVSGKIDAGSFQKLRDMLGHTGPVIVKGGQ